MTTGPELGPYTLRIADLAAGTTRAVATGFFAGASFAPDGSGLAFARAFVDGHTLRANLYRVVLEGGRVRRLTSDGNAADPVWGLRRIAFDRARRATRRGDHDKLDVYTVLPDGSGRRQLTRPIRRSCSRGSCRWRGRTTGPGWRPGTPGRTWPRRGASTP